MRLSWIGAAALVAILMMIFTPTIAAAATDTPAVTQAKRQMAEAQAELSKANATLAAIAQKTVKELEATPDWQQAVAAVRNAQKRHAAAVKSVHDKLRSQPDYQAALAERTLRQQERDALREQAKPQPDKLSQAAADLLSASAAVTRLENSALSSDERVAKTQGELNEARSRFDALRKTLPELAKKDPAYEPAHDRAQQAAAKVADAGKQLAQAKQQQDQADSQRMNQDIENRRDQMRNLTGFRR